MPSHGAHMGGYNEVNAKKMQGVQLPDKIRCQCCKLWKGPSQYSNKQLSDLRFRVLHFGPLPVSGQGHIKCRLCTGQQVTELKCGVCDEVKPLSEFGKTHRRDPDNARCSLCVDQQVALLPGCEDVPEEHDSEGSNEYWDEDATTSTIDSEGGAPLDLASHTLTSLKLVEHNSMTSSSGTSKLSTDGTESTVSGGEYKSRNRSSVGGGGVYMTQTRNKPAAAKQYTAYDSTGMAHSRYRAPSTTASSMSWATPPSASSKGKFPKPSRGKNSSAPLAKSDIAKRNYTVSVDDDDDDDDDYRLGDSD